MLLNCLPLGESRRWHRQQHDRQHHFHPGILLMVDIATLGIAVESKQVDSATTSLGKFTGSAGAAERAVTKMGKESSSAGRAAAAANDNAARSANKAAVAYAGWERAAANVGRVLGAIVGALATGALVRYADAWSDMQSQVGAATRDMEAAPAMMQRLVDIANASYSPLQQTVETYSRNVSVLRDMGGTAKDAADFTESMNNALVLTATRGERAASVQNALSKAMAVGKLQADGLETVLANGGAVAEALADELGTTVNGLRAMATAGRITGDVIANALIKRTEEFRARAAEMPATVADAFVRIQTNLTAFVGQMDQATGASGFLAEKLIWVADNIDTIAKVAAVAGVALTVAFAPAIFATIITGLNAATAAAVAFSLAISANPIGATTVALAAATAAVMFFGDEVAISADGTVTLRDYAVAAFTSIGDAVRSLGEWFGTVFGGLEGHVDTAITAATTLFTGGFTTWMTVLRTTINWMIGVVKTGVENIATLAKVGFEHGFTAAGQLAYNAVVEYLALMMQKAVEAANFIIEELSQGINRLNRILPNTMQLGNPFLTLDYDPHAIAESIRGTKVEVTDAVKEIDAAMSANAKANMSRDYLGELGAAWTGAAEKVSAARRAIEGEDTGDGLGPGGGALRSANNDNSKSGGRKRKTESEKAAEKAAKEAQRLSDAYDGITRRAQQRIVDLQIERDALGMTEEATARLRYETELFNSAINAGINLTAQQEQQLRGYAATMAAIEEETRLVKEQMDFARGVTGGFFSDMRSGLESGKGIWRSFADSVSSALDKIINKLQDGLLNSLFGGVSGDGGAGLLGGLFGGGRGKSGGGKSSGDAVSAMTNFLGFKETGASGKSINSFMKSNGVDIDAARTAWCAGFVNSSLESVGVDGSGSLVANSFLNWGSKVNPGSALRGDVLVKSRGLGANQTGGHVGMATGASRMGSNGLELQMISGNQGNAVSQTWEKAAALDVRRASETLSESSKQISGAASSFGQNFDLSTSTMTSTMEGTVSQFAPKFGSSLDQLLKSIQGGGGSGLGSLVSSLFGLSPRAAAVTAAGGAGLWSSGGYTGPGGVHEPAGVVHKGEVVWSQRDVARAGGVGTVEAMRKGRRGYAGGGAVAGVSASGGGVSINIINNAGAQVSQQERTNADGSTSIDIMVDRMVAQKIGTRGTDSNNMMRQNFGARQVLARR
ncbi:tape measure protein [Aureimonas fodinaquatilis]|uniref:Tape measure protein n=1 Tax=Aureimonas fodinaquatilis TaxID=2565783 RepID=A0A5B0DV99_9HYPH|nr:tape measure protein [Aureimonas fodinaquatilis]KAA0970313.1 tape measure protein [Aureimonas fodinaquatilis]